MVPAKDMELLQRPAATSRRTPLDTEGHRSPSWLGPVQLTPTPCRSLHRDGRILAVLDWAEVQDRARKWPAWDPPGLLRGGGDTDECRDLRNGLQYHPNFIM
mmetsp:Transcript_11078/g.26764  ORF Transcript_11078/g.26764 Transcript_11078/m.26764 type:complete len:102 (-) Transcript_11078:170-475(-)